MPLFPPVGLPIVPVEGINPDMASEFIVKPDPDDPRLTRVVPGMDQDGAPITTSVTVERPLTLFLNRREIVTMMTIGDYPEYLAVGYLVNQNMLRRRRGRRSRRSSSTPRSTPWWCAPGTGRRTSRTS